MADFSSRMGTWLVVCAIALTQSGCFSSDPAPPAAPEPEPTATENPVSTGPSCPILTGTSWVPNIAGASESNHNDTNASTGVKVFPVATHTGSGKIIGINQGYSEASDLISVSIDMSDDLLAKGSLSLVAESTSIPAALVSAGISVWPVLVSLHDGTNEYVKLSGCSSGGFYSCTGGDCDPVAACGPGSGSAYLGDNTVERREKWEEQQRLLSDDQLSVNSFPTCNWSGTANTGQALACPFTDSGFTVSGKLRTGTYIAKYLLVSNAIGTLSSYTGGVKVSAIRKRDGDNGSGSNGAIDLNVVLVGSRNIADSRTAKGKQNLDALFSHVYDHFYTSNSPTVGVKLGKISVYEWTCENGGDSYATVYSDDTGKMFKAGSALLPASTEAKAVNVFLVSSIPYGGSGTILGQSGGITGAMINGTTSSGTVFSSFNKLATFNSTCNGTGTCSVDKQDLSFIDMGNTISHEVGHFLGLNHLSERSGAKHDVVMDTPLCTQTQTVGGTAMITIDSCYAGSTAHPVSGNSCSSQCPGYDGVTTFCPLVEECQFNHVMWWTIKNYGSSGTGDGTLFSTNSGAILNYSPYVQ